ncbi:unnamed protein product [Meloidogyne enterolobii]|uniref:Uncharacterized protein n=1 Tax=Meloidogyne enterolobii TaxID=390850 RepID=A0ACB0Z639_MELEN
MFFQKVHKNNTNYPLFIHFWAPKILCQFNLSPTFFPFSYFKFFLFKLFYCFRLN